MNNKEEKQKLEEMRYYLLFALYNNYLYALIYGETKMSEIFKKDIDKEIKRLKKVK